MKKSVKKPNVYKRIFKFMPYYVISIIFLIFSQYLDSLVSLFIGQSLSIFAGETNIILPKFLAKFFDTTTKYTQLKSLAVIFICTGLVMIIFRLLRTIFRRIFSLSVDSDVSSTFFNHALKLPKKYLTSHSTGDIIQRNIQDTKKFTNFVSDATFNLIYSVCSIAVVLFNMFYLSKLNFVISLIIVGVAVGFEVVYAIVVIRKKEEQLSALWSSMNEVTQQSFSNILMVKSFNGEKHELKKLSKLNDDTKDMQYNVDILYAKYWAIMDVFNVVYNAVIILLIGIMFIKGTIGLGIATSLIMFNQEVVDASSTIIDRINRFIRNSVAGKRLNEYLVVPDEYCVNGTLKPVLTGDIQISNLCMKYDNEQNYALQNINLHIYPGQTIGIVGKSGSGKSTLLNILARLDDYDSGSIKYDGVELKDIEKHYLRQNIGIVNQDSYVFTTTVKNNLTILNKNEDNLQQNVNKVCLQEDIEKFPQGMLTMVGEKGVTLSGGQRQRISIARTLMKNKNILFLDDSLSAVDNNVSKTIRSALKDDKITTLIISHNFINIMDADQIIVLDKGKIVQQGTHEELIKVKGIYKDIWDLQQKVKDNKLEGGSYEEEK